MKARHKDTGEIIELAEEGIISCDGRRFCWYQVELIPEPIDDFKPSLPSNLDEAAEEYGRKEYSHAIHFWDEGLSKNKPEVMKEDFVDAFKAGSEWQKTQMKNGAVEAMEQETLYSTLYDILTEQYGEVLESHAMWQCIIALGIRPFKDGNQWCFLYGNNIQEGICGFGETIFKAAWDFYTNIKTEEARKEENK